MANVQLSTKAVGSIVKIPINNAYRNFIIVHQGYPSSLYDGSCNGTWLLMQDIFEEREWNTSIIDVYASSTIHSYLNSTFLSMIDNGIQKHILQVKIPHGAGNLTDVVYSGIYGLSTRVFLLSQKEVGHLASIEVVDGSRLSYFLEGSGLNDTDANNLRIAYFNGIAKKWWHRTPSPSMNKYAYVAGNGTKGRFFADTCTNVNGIRPAFILSPSLMVSDDGTVLANNPPTIPGAIVMPNPIRSAVNYNVSWGASTDPDGNLQGYQLQRSLDNGANWGQIYQAAATSTTDSVVFGTSQVRYRVRAFDSDGAYSAFQTSANQSVLNNSAPSTPGGFTLPNPIRGGVNFNISWGTSTDPDGNLQGYEVDRSLDGGTNWSNIYRASGTSTTDFLTFGTAQVRYRVRAYDTLNAYSGYQTSANQTVLNNTAPTAPGSITVPDTAVGGGTLAISWAAATDAQNNLAGYELERSVAGGGYTNIYKGPNLGHTDTITKGWANVTYRVRAYDTYNEYSGYTTSATRTVDNNTAPTIACSQTNLGARSEGFSVSYTVNDADGDTLTVVETMDGATTRSYSAAAGTVCSFDVTGLTFQKLLNGAHTLGMSVRDPGGKSAAHQVAWTKQVHNSRITLINPIITDAVVSRMVLSVTGDIPADASFQVMATNNAKDASPAWEDITAFVQARRNYIFTNKTAANGPAFNFIITASRGASGLGGYISAVSGALE